MIGITTALQCHDGPQWAALSGRNRQTSVGRIANAIGAKNTRRDAYGWDRWVWSAVSKDGTSIR